MPDTFDDEYDDEYDLDDGEDEPGQQTSDATDIADDGGEFTLAPRRPPSTTSAQDLGAVDSLADRLGVARLRQLNASQHSELQAFLSGGLQAFLVRKGPHHVDYLPPLIGEARREVSARIAIGTVAPAPIQKAAKLREYMASLPNTALRFVDPEIHLLEDGSLKNDGGNLKRGPSSWTYLAGGTPATVDPAWISQVLAVQLSSGATVLLTPTGWLDGANPTRSMPLLMNWVDATRQIAGAAPMFVNVTIDSSWVTNRNLRDKLLDEIVESNEDHWYIRVKWPLLPDNYTQLSDQAVLEGYKVLVTTAADERKVVILPQSDLTGWVMAGLGAAGFSTGQSASARNFSHQRGFARQPNQPAPPPRVRYFERDILATIEHQDHATLVGDPAYRACACRYCVAIGAGSQSAGAWDSKQEHLHYLLRCARLQELTWDANRRQEVRSRVARARREAEAAVRAVRLRSVPAHLPMWEALLR